ncbi:WD40 repeat-like protein [Obba rivulosa]|uniref:WD40 repeat-like protein n=1 Tax=Obba rivulosa TaxID=1052685 RepID=A0A8E2DS08_9APHY|nr:WD40 repeat-like protein [Obba rivulosa]
MPVAVERPATMTPLKSHLLDGQHLQDSPNSELPKPRKRKQARAQKAETQEPEPSAGTSRVPESKPWSWRSLTDVTASRVPPFFTKDGKYFFSAVGSSVKIYSVATGQVVSTLDATNPRGTGAAVTSAMLSPHNPYQIITGSANGCIRIWDFLDAALLQTVRITRPILNLTAHESLKDYVFVAVAQPSRRLTSKAHLPKAEHNVVVMRVSLKPTSASAGLSAQTPSDMITVGKTRSTTGLALSPSGAWLVATGGHKAYVCPTANIEAGFTKFVSPEALTCLAFHPSEEYFATGDSQGVVRIWYCLNEAATVKTTCVEKTAQTTTLHWHAHAVSSLAFTANGAYLLSGGEESVLVIWQLHTGEKEFVPRVGSPITHIAVSNTGTEEEYLLGLADASFAFVRAATLKVSKTIARVKLDPAISYDRPSASTSVPLAVHPPTSTFILPSSHPSSLQTFSPSSSRLLHELEVSPSNKISRRDDKPLEPSRVESAAVSEDGRWMVTVDSRAADDTFRGEVYLKFWSWESASGSWTLNTRIDRPHGAQHVTSLAFTPGMQSKDTLFLVSTGGDGQIKTWRIRSVRTKSGETDDFWVVRSNYSFRSEIPRHVSWSMDGSVLCVSFGSHVTLFDPIANSLHQVLTSPQCKEVSSAFFIGHSSRYLAVVGTRDVLLWDLVLQTIHWQYRSPTIIERTFPHPREEVFAVFERGIPTGPGELVTQVVILSPSSPAPVRTHTIPFHLRNVVSHASLNALSSSPTSFTLVGITTSWSFVIFGDDVRLPDEEGSHANEIVEDAGARPRTLFQDIFGKSALAELTTSAALPARGAEVAQPWRGKEVAGIFDAPAYLMPPLESVFDALTDGFLSLRPAQESQNVDEDEQEREDADIDMYTDGDRAPVVVGTMIDRVVTPQEMDAFVELFVQHALKAPSPHVAPHPHMNGFHKPNGTSKHSDSHGPAATPPPKPSRLNGSTPKPVVQVASATRTSEEKASPAVAAGKKRKKSLD